MTRTTLLPRVILLATIQLCAVAYGEQDSKRQSLAFVNINVVPMDSERVIAGQTVLIQDGRISAIDPSATASIPDGTTRIDGTDKYLMPGLADMHVHPGNPEELIVYIANGVTTTRNMWGFPDEHLVWRDQVQRGEIVGPTIYTTGPILDGNPPTFAGSEVVETPEEAQRAVGEHKAAGYDFIKVLSGLKPDVYDAITAAAAAQRIRVVGHVPLSIDLDHALASGIASIEHLTGYGFALRKAASPVVDRSNMRTALGAWEFFDESRLGEVVEKTKQAGVWNCPTLEALRAYLPENIELLNANGGRKYLSPSMRQWWDRALSSPRREETIALVRLSIEPRSKVLQALNAGGARILLGTDAPNTGVVPGFSALRELQNFVDAGLTPYEAIRSGTFDAAEFVDALDEWGTVAVGRRADLILVDANPLDDVANVSRRAGVMVRGRWYSEKDLQAKLDAVAEKYAKMKAEGEATVVFENVNVVPMDREVVLPDQTVMVRDGKIVSIHPASEAEVPAFATRIDGSDKFLMPGLADMHVHIWGESDLPLFLANGVTSVRNMWGSPAQTASQQAVESGKFLGPTIYSTSALIDGDPPIWDGSEVAATPDEARKIVAAQKAAGYSDLKLYSLLSPGVFAAIVEEAKVNGMRFVGHVPDAVGLASALDAGMASIEHLTGYITALQRDDAPAVDHSFFGMRFGAAARQVDEAKIPSVVNATREAGTWNCVTLVVMDKLAASLEERKKLLESPEMRYVAPTTRGMWDPSKSKRLAKLTDEDFAALRDGTAMLRKITRALHEGGARILLGTDCPNPLVVPGFSIHEELRNLVQAGLSPYEAIRAGTAGAAEFLGKTGEFGVAHAAARADLILLEANPLDDVANVKKRIGVMVRGKWLPEEELHRMLEETAASFTPARNPFDGMADLPKEGDRLGERRYEMLMGDVAFGYERIAVDRLGSGERVIHSQMVLTAFSRAKTRTRLAAGKSGFGESLQVEYEAAAGKSSIECSRQNGTLVLHGTLMGTVIDRSEAIDKEQLLAPSSVAAACLLAHRLRSLEIGDEIRLSDKAVDLFPTLNFNNRTQKLKREADRSDGQRVYSIEGKSIAGPFTGNLVVDPDGLPTEYRIVQKMGAFVFRLLEE